MLSLYNNQITNPGVLKRLLYYVVIDIKRGWDKKGRNRLTKGSFSLNKILTIAVFNRSQIKNLRGGIANE